MDRIARAISRNPRLGADRAEVLCRAFDRTCETWQLQPAGDLEFNRFNATTGAPVLGKSGETGWLRVRMPMSDAKAETTLHAFKREGVLTQPVHADIPSPRILRADDFIHPEGAFFSCLMEQAANRPSDSVWANAQVAISDAWLDRLQRAITAINRTEVHRAKFSQPAISAVINRVWGDTAPHEVEHWQTSHCDFHWANLAAPELCIMDWEEWGPAPAGFDIVTLSVYAHRRPDIAERITRQFSEILQTNSALVARLYYIGVLLLNRELMQIDEQQADQFRLECERLISVHR